MYWLWLHVKENNGTGHQKCGKFDIISIKLFLQKFQKCLPDEDHAAGVTVLEGNGRTEMKRQETRKEVGYRDTLLFKNFV